MARPDEEDLAVGAVSALLTRYSVSSRIVSSRGILVSKPKPKPVVLKSERTSSNMVTPITSPQVVPQQVRRQLKTQHGI